jgi:hypothetical protein
MSKSRSNSLQNKCQKPSRDKGVDWGAFVKFANEFDVCVIELKKCRDGTLKVQRKYSPSDKQCDEPSDMELKSLARELRTLERLERSFSRTEQTTS